ncbi:MAG: transcriptional regulator [Haloarculaceae archaeon]
MRETTRTTRERIADRLSDEALSPADIAREFDVRAETALDHVDHLARSLAESEDELMVAPPECRECGFDGFDRLVNRPSRCPECKSEDVRDPVFTVE